MSEYLILALEGSTRICSAALIARVKSVETGAREDSGGPEGWAVLARRVERDERNQAKVLLRLAGDMLAERCSEPKDVDAVVVGSGPGTFTGVRITVATARALGLSLDVPVLGMSSLSALAAAGAVSTTIDLESVAMLVPVVDARRDQVFFSLYERTFAGVSEGSAQSPIASLEEGGWRRSEDIGVCDRQLFGVRLAEIMAGRRRPPGGPAETGGDGCALVLGDDADLAPRLPPGVRFQRVEVGAEHLVVGQGRLREPGDHPTGDRLRRWLDEAAATGEPGMVMGAEGSPESVKPIYVRSPDADVHITKMKDPWAGGS